MHMYEVVGSRGEGQKLSNEMERITSFDDRQEYMSLHDPQQEGANEYQQPQWCVRNMKTTVNNDEMKGSSDCHISEYEIKQTKRCLCVLSLLIVILFLITASSLGLAAYGFSIIRNTNDLEYRLNTIKSEVVSQRTSINTLNSRLNEINSDVSTVRSSVTSLESQLNTLLISANVSSALRSQPRK